LQNFHQDALKNVLTARRFLANFLAIHYGCAFLDIGQRFALGGRIVFSPRSPIAST